MKKLISLFLSLLIIISIGITASAFYTVDEMSEKIKTIPKSTATNEDGFYFSDTGDVVLYAKTDKTAYVVGDSLDITTFVMNFSDDEVYVWNHSLTGDPQDIIDKYITLKNKTTLIRSEIGSPAQTPSMWVGDPYTPKKDYKINIRARFNPGSAKTDIGSDVFTEAGTYTVSFYTEYSFINNLPGRYTDEKIYNANKKYQLLLSFDIEVYEDESDIPDTTVPVVEGPEKSKLSYIEKHPIVPTTDNPQPTTKKAPTPTKANPTPQPTKNNPAPQPTNGQPTTSQNKTVPNPPTDVEGIAVALITAIAACGVLLITSKKK